MTFKDEQEFPPVSKRNEYMQLHAFVSGQTLTVRHRGHHIFLILAWQKRNRKVVTLLRFEPLHMNNSLPPPPAKQNPQNLHYLHCFNKGNDTLRELLTPTTDCSCQKQADSPGEEQSHVHDGPPDAGAQLLEAWGLGASSLPPHLPWCPPCCFTSWWGWAELCHRVPHHWPLSILDFESAVISCWHQASFQQHTTAPLPLLIHADLFPKAVSPHRPMCSSSKKCSSSNILSVTRSWLSMTPQPALTLLVHSGTTLFQVFSYHITGESFQEVSCSKVN